MKLKHIHIDEYKLFHNFDIDFCNGGTPLNIIVVVGINGSGKSTLLEYIAAKKSIDTSLTGNIQVEMDGKDDAFFVPPLLSQRDLYTEVMADLQYFPSNSVDSVLGQQLEEKILKYVDKMVYVDGKTSFDAYRTIQNMLDVVFADFRLKVRFKGLDADKHLRFTNEEGAEFGVDGLSDGEKQLLAKLFPLFIGGTKKCVVLMDEPDRSLHPSWQSYLLPVLRRFAVKNDCQFVIATHSPQIISAAHQEEIRILSRNAGGHIEAQSCEDGPYGWTVERVLDEIQGVTVRRVPEVEARLDGLRNAVKEDRYDTEGFKDEMAELGQTLGYSDPDLALIRMEIIRKRKGGNR